MHLRLSACVLNGWGEGGGRRVSVSLKAREVRWDISWCLHSATLSPRLTRTFVQSVLVPVRAVPTTFQRLSKLKLKFCFSPVFRPSNMNFIFRLFSVSYDTEKQIFSVTSCNEQIKLQFCCFSSSQWVWGERTASTRVEGRDTREWRRANLAREGLEATGFGRQTDQEGKIDIFLIFSLRYQSSYLFSKTCSMPIKPVRIENCPAIILLEKRREPRNALL